MSGDGLDEWYTKRFWDALENDQFLVGTCRDCDAAHFPPAPVCPHCEGTGQTSAAEGFGTLYAYTRQFRTAPAFDSPVTLGTVELAEGPRVLMRIRGDYDALEIGETVSIDIGSYDEDYDRGHLDGYPMFYATPE